MTAATRRAFVLSEGNRIMLSRRHFLSTAAAATAALTLRPQPRSCAAESQAKSTAVAPFGELIEIAGRPYNRGVAYGQRFAPQIRDFYKSEIEDVFVEKHFPKADLVNYAAACLRVIEDECPIIAEELAGMAKGTGLSVEEHVLITLHEELYHRGTIPAIPHCTAVGLTPPVTSGSTLIGQTWDWMTTVAGKSTMLHWRREEGPSLLAYAYPGLWVGAGMNSEGLALCWTSAELGKPHQQPRVGLPSYVFLTHLLHQPSLDAVKAVAMKNRHAGWFTFVMGDGEGRLLNVEGSPEGITCEDGQGQMVRIGFGSRERTVAVAGQKPTQHPRCGLTEAALRSHSEPHSADSLQGIFGDPRHQVCVGVNTVDMMVFDTTRRVARLSRGPDYGVHWHEYRFPTDEQDRAAGTTRSE
jgi:hypothetical protein